MNLGAVELSSDLNSDLDRAAWEQPSKRYADLCYFNFAYF